MPSPEIEPNILTQRVRHHWHTVCALPQVSRGIVPESTAKEWLYKLVQQEADDAKIVWHIRRAAGWGGSEAHLLVWHHVEMGRPCPDAVHERGYSKPTHQSIDSAIDGKLLRSVPTQGGFFAERGLAYEPIIDEVFQSTMRAEGYRIERAHDLEDRIRDTEARPVDMPDWLIGNPDAIYRIDGRLTIIDFKAPTQATFKAILDKGYANPGHDAQVHHYGLCSRFILGATPEHLAVVYLSPDLYENYNTRNRALFVAPVLRSPDIERILLSSGNELWYDCVLQGRYPTYVPVDKKTFVLNKVTAQEIPTATVTTTQTQQNSAGFRMPPISLDCDTPDLLRQIAQFHIIKTAAAEAYEKLREALISRSQTGKLQQTVDLEEIGAQATVSVAIQHTPDPDHAYRLAVNAGANPTDLHVQETDQKTLRAMRPLIESARHLAETERLATLPPDVANILQELGKLTMPSSGRKDPKAILEACKNLGIDLSEIPRTSQARVTVTLQQPPDETPDTPDQSNNKRKPR